jgi:hypothetical protein
MYFGTLHPAAAILSIIFFAAENDQLATLWKP